MRRRRMSSTLIQTEMLTPSAGESGTGLDTALSNSILKDSCHHIWPTTIEKDHCQCRQVRECHEWKLRGSLRSIQGGNPPIAAECVVQGFALLTLIVTGGIRHQC